MEKQLKTTCWICKGEKFKFYKASNLKDITSESFAITDVNYGVTGELVKCFYCGFIQCVDLTDVLNYYQDLEDTAYEDTREQRALQARKILELTKKLSAGNKLLDIGAGSGILVEEASEMGFEAKGVEPSKWLYEKARERNLPVVLGVFPHPEIVGEFDVITLIDVIEHVNNPVELLEHSAKFLSEKGIVVVSTPDINSFFSKLLGRRWWHLRVAHIGYFSPKTLKLAGEKAGLAPIFQGRPKWYFKCDYLFNRLLAYLPKRLRLKAPKFLSKITIPLNLGDSTLIIFKKSS